jgi:SAM-dependent methyltransferase
MSNPLCPVTGEPAARLVQWVSCDFLARLWRVILKVDARSSLGEQQHVGLWASPTGLYFFDPMLPGDEAFYTQLAINLGFSYDSVIFRHAYTLAAKRTMPGDRVLDVGCGTASFRAVIPHARYVGLDPIFGGVGEVSKETLSDHLSEHSAAYDTVCAFEVLEHVVSPAQMFADLVRAARPGGLVIVSVPHVPSAFTRIPNNIINAPPHHLTWWTEPALRALARAGGATVESIERAEWCASDSLFYWVARWSPIRCSRVHFRAAWSWYAALLIGIRAARLMAARNKVPKTTDEGAGLVMVARRNAVTRSSSSQVALRREPTGPPRSKRVPQGWQYSVNSSKGNNPI